MNDLILEDLKKKYPEYFQMMNPENMEAAKQEAAKQKEGMGIAQFISGFGAAAAGRDVNKDAEFFENRRKQIDENTIGAAEKKNKEMLDFYLKQKMMEQNQQDRDLDRQFKMSMLNERNLDRKQLVQDKQDEKMFALKTPYGIANTIEDAKNLKEAAESKANFDEKINELIQLRKSKGGGDIIDREAVARGKQLSKDLLLEYKNMAKLGVLSKSDEDIINAIIPQDPLQFRSPLEVMNNQDSILNNMQKFKSDSDKDFQTRLKMRLRDKGAGYNQQNAQTQNEQMQNIEPDVKAYADKHGITYDQAMQIKIKRGGK